MFLSRLIVKNYRSIKFLDLEFVKGKNVIIGRNNAGKSNIIKAIGLVLGEQSPTYSKYENIKEIDFFSWREESGDEPIQKTADEIIIYCEIVKSDEEELNWDEIEGTYGSYMMRKPLTLDLVNNNNFDEAINTIFSINFSMLDKKDYLNPKKIDTLKEKLRDVQTFGYIFKAWKDENGIKKDMRLLIKTEDNKWKLIEKPFIRTELLQSAIIPSFRDPSTQLRLNQWSWYGKLMKYLVVQRAESNEKLKKALKDLKSASNEIFRDIKSEIEQSSLDVAFPGAEIHFQLAEDTKHDIHKNVVIHIDDGFKSILYDKGAGIQSATIIGLFSYYTKHVNTKTGALLCIEEPELYLHPHACRVINNRLEDFVGDTNQVILTTHSPEFVKPSKGHLNIILVRKTNEGTKAINLNINEYKHLLLNNSYAEIFFADKVIICEGYDNYVLKFIAGKRLNEKNVSVIGVGGKDNISKFEKLTSKLNIETYILTDFDFLLRDNQEDRKEFNAKAHESVENLPLEEIVKGNAGKLRSMVTKLRKDIKEKHQELFYTAKKINEFDDKDMKKRIEDVLDNLRKNGIWILDGEIEDYIKDKSILSNNGKFDQDSIFKISELINSRNKDIKVIFEQAGFQNFINRVIGD